MSRFLPVSLALMAACAAPRAAWVEFEACGQKAKEFIASGLVVEQIPAPNLRRVMVDTMQVSMVIEFRGGHRASVPGIACTMLYVGGKERAVIGDYATVKAKILGGN